MLNKRKALIGYVVYKFAKPLVKHSLRARAKGAHPGRKAVPVGIGALAGALAFWRKRRPSGESEAPPES